MCGMRHERWTRRGALGAMAGSGLGPEALKAAPVQAKDPLKITKLETFLVKPRWVFLKVHTNAGITGLGEPLLEGRALTIRTAIQEIEPYLIGKDPRPVQHHWQAIYRHAFYRGGPILTSALSGIDQALWDIKGKALGVPVYELLGGADEEPGAGIRARRRIGRGTDSGSIEAGVHGVQDRARAAAEVPEVHRDAG
jgi:galactonate dehydratase